MKARPQHSRRRDESPHSAQGPSRDVEAELREAQERLDLALRQKETDRALMERVLIVEDDVSSAASMSLLLELSGHTVAVAHDGPSSIETARRFRPEVVVCDIGLPGEMDGYAVAKAFRADPSLRPAFLIALTGYGQHEDRRRAEAAGFDTHMTKPADPSVLKALLSEAAILSPDA